MVVPKTKTTKKITSITPGIVRLASVGCLVLLLELVSSVAVAQEDLISLQGGVAFTEQDALVFKELSPTLVNDFLRETKATVSSALVPVADSTYPVVKSQSRAPAAVPLGDAAWLFGAGFVGFILLSNRRAG